MSQLIDVHESGEFIYTLGEDGVLSAYQVQVDGTITKVDTFAALVEEAQR